MTQAELNVAVATATGEPVSRIAEMGFSVADPAEVFFDPEPDDVAPQTIDWDEVDAERDVVFPVSYRRRRVAK
jgi:hypothetical protein